MFLIFALLISSIAYAKEIALTFDDSPVGSTSHFETQQRTLTLVEKLKNLNVPSVMVFANPCKGKNTAATLAQLDLYRKSGHQVQNHTCKHSRLDDVGFQNYVIDIKDAESLLSQFLIGAKFFRYPYLNEGNKADLRNQVRDWLKDNGHRNGFVSVDNDDYQFSFKLNKAKSLGKDINYAKVKTLFLSHILGAVEFYDNLAVETIGYSPKHILLLHEMDATVLFIDSLISELRARGWKIISAEEAYQDPLYKKIPQSTYANNGVVAQIAHEKTGEKKGYFQLEKINAELDKILGL